MLRWKWDQSAGSARPSHSAALTLICKSLQFNRPRRLKTFFTSARLNKAHRHRTGEETQYKSHLNIHTLTEKRFQCYGCYPNRAGSKPPGEHDTPPPVLSYLLVSAGSWRRTRVMGKEVKVCCSDLWSKAIAGTSHTPPSPLQTSIKTPRGIITHIHHDKVWKKYQHS